MHKVTILVTTVVLLSCSCVTLSGTMRKSIIGRWEGSAEFSGMKKQAVIDFIQETDVVRASISVPEERLLGKQLHNFRHEPPRLYFEIPNEGGRLIFDGTHSGDTITGTLRGGELQAGLSLHRTGDVPPLPYAQEEVRFRNGDVTLAGTLLLPRSKGQHPSVILIHGSSTPSRDDFRFYGDLFVRRGIAALIYDKRQLGRNLGDLRDLTGDALAAVELLKSRSDINPKQIGLWGFSQGGWVAPIAAARSKDVAFVITVSGPAVSYADVNIYADATRLRARGFSEEEIREATIATKRLDEYVRSGGDRQDLQSFLDEARTKRWATHTTILQRAPSAEEMQTWLRWRNLDIDPVSYWEQINVPVLATFGELDDVVPVQISVERIEAALRRSGNKDVTIKVFPKASHEIKPAPDFLNIMLDWTVARVNVVK